MLFEKIKELCSINGTSGREHAVSEYIISELKEMGVDYHKDNLGNVIAFKKGKKTPKNKIMVAAHMDEVGLIITGITEDGSLRFSTVGGINPKVIIGREVVLENGVRGVVGTKPIHLQDAEERETAVPCDKLYIDIGADSAEEAEEKVSLGDCAYFVGDYCDLGTEQIIAKAIDDRAGCAMMLLMLQEELEFDAYFAFTVQEEVGLNGAKTAAFAIEPDVAIVIETTASGDVAGVTGLDRVTAVGGGVVISYMDRSTIYDKELYNLAFKLAKENDIKCQTKTMIAGGNDAGAIHVSGKGVRTIALSIPSKYIHSPSNVVSKADTEATYKLSLEMANAVGDL